MEAPEQISPPHYTYMLSNRYMNQDCGYPDQLHYQFNVNLGYQYYNDSTLVKETADQATWIGMLADDLYRVSGGNSNDVVYLCFYIHGFGNSASDARIGHAWYGSRLLANGLPRSLVVGVSWPSNCGSWHDTGVRDAMAKAELSADLLIGIVAIIPKVKAALSNKYGADAPPLRTALICHSMGNYLMAYVLGNNLVLNYEHAVNDVIMLAPCTDWEIFTEGSNTLVQGQAICKMASDAVLVLWSTLDTVLSYAADIKLLPWSPLGCYGPLPPISDSINNMEKIDCSEQTADYITKHYVPSEYYSSLLDQLVHSSYRFTPLLLLIQADFLRLAEASRKV